MIDLRNSIRDADNKIKQLKREKKDLEVQQFRRERKMEKIIGKIIKYKPISFPHYKLA